MAGGGENLQPLWKSLRQFLRKLGINLPQDPALPLLEYSQRMLHPATEILAYPSLLLLIQNRHQKMSANG